MYHGFAPDWNESILQENTIFCCWKKATNGSSFYSVQKKCFTKNLGVESWIKAQKSDQFSVLIFKKKPQNLFCG